MPDPSQFEGDGAQLLVGRKRHLHLGAVIIVAVDVAELPVGEFQVIVEAGLEFLPRHDGVQAEVVGILLHGIPFTLFLLARVHRPEDQRIPGFLDERILEFHPEAVLLDGRRIDLGLEHRDGVLMLDVPLGTLLEFGLQLLVQDQLDQFIGRDQFAQGIRLVVIDLQLQRVRHLALVVHPQFQAVLLRIELGDQLLGGKAPDFHRIDLGAGRHEGQESRPQAHPFLLHDELLGGFLAENVQFHVGLPREAQGRILHVELLEFIDGIIVHRTGTERVVEETDAFLVRLVDVVVVRVTQGVHPVHGVLDVAEAEEAPVIGLRGGVRTMQEDGGIGMVLIQEDRRTLDGHQRVAVLDDARHAHRVDLGARGEDEGESLVHVALVIVGDRAGDVQGIGPVAVQVGIEGNDEALPGNLVLGFLLQRRGKEDGIGVLDHDVLVEGELDLRLVRRDVHRAGKGIRIHQHRRDGVLGTSAGRGGRVRASRGEHHRPEDQGGRDERNIFCQFLHIQLVTNRYGTPIRCPRWWSAS